MFKINNNARSISFFLLCFILLLLNSFFFSLIEHYYFPGLKQNPIENENMIFQVIIGVLISPIVETYVFQVLSFIISKKLKIKNTFIRVIVPSFIFALSHNFNTIYICMTFFMGIIFTYMYIVYRENEKKNAFLLVTIIHIFYNGIALLI